MAPSGSGGSRLPRLSPTRLNSYLTCARQYYYAYIRKLPRRARGYFSFGTSLHGALQEFHAQGGAATQDVQQLIGQLESSWVDAGYRTPEEQAERLDLGRQILESYYSQAEERQAESETLFLEKTLSVRCDGFVLSGRIDRIDRRPDGVLEVLDYKSGGYLPTPDEIESDLAIGVYQLLVSRTMETTPVVGTILNIRLGESTSIVRDTPALDAVGEKVDQTFRILTADTRFAPQPGKHCYHCEYALHCPAALRQ